jgi:hypothetical protein
LKTSRTTRRVRVKLDFVLEYDADLDGVPGHLGSAFPMVKFIMAGIQGTSLNPEGSAQQDKPRIEAVSSGARWSATLDFRKLT